MFSKRLATFHLITRLISLHFPGTGSFTAVLQSHTTGHDEMNALQITWKSNVKLMTAKTNLTRA